MSLDSTDRWGYAVGAGIEYGFTPNWSAKLEYMHYVALGDAFKARSIALMA
jgi:opacity protein-like surface antigen